MKKLLFGLIALLSFYSCSKDNAEDTIDSPMKSTQQIIPCGDVSYTALVIPTSIDLISPGTIIMQNDEFNLYVTIQTSDNWQLQMTHVKAGDCYNLPLNYAGPLNSVSILYNDFPYAETHPAGTTTHTVIVPLQSLPNILCITVAASVVIVENGQIVQSETTLTMENGLVGGTNPFSYLYYINSCE